MLYFILHNSLLVTSDSRFIISLQKLNGGTTAVCALLINKKLYIAWVGDSMASLVTYGNVKQLVNPHRPTREVSNMDFLFLLIEWNGKYGKIIFLTKHSYVQIVYPTVSMSLKYPALAMNSYL